MPGPDLSAARARVEALLDDTCVVTRDDHDVHDDELDPDTGELVDPQAAGQLYTGPCLVLPAAPGVDPAELFGAADLDRPGRYRVLLRLDAPDLPAGARLTVTQSRRDPLLTGAAFRVTGPVQLASLTVVRQVEVEQVR